MRNKTIRIIDYKISTTSGIGGGEQHEVIIYVDEEGKRSPYVSDRGATIGEVMIDVLQKALKAKGIMLDGSMPRGLHLSDISLSRSSGLSSGHVSMYQANIYSFEGETSICFQGKSQSPNHALWQALAKALASPNFKIKLVLF